MSQFCELTYGEVLRELRIFHDYKQRDLSDYLNITSQAYSNYENNKRMPDIETMRKIANFYNITLDKLISYRYTTQIEDARDYGTLYRGVSDSGVVIPLTAQQAKLVKEIVSLSADEQDTYYKLIGLVLKNKM